MPEDKKNELLSRNSEYCEGINCKYYKDYTDVGGKKVCNTWKTPVENILAVSDKPRSCIPRHMMRQTVRDSGENQWGRDPDNKILSDGGTLKSLEPSIIKYSSKKSAIQQFVELHGLEKFGSYTEPNEFKGEFLKGDEAFKIKETDRYVEMMADNLNKGRMQKIFPTSDPKLLDNMSMSWSTFWRDE